MVRGHMCCGIVTAELVLRLGADGANAALDEPHTRPMDFTGRPMTGFVYVAPASTAWRNPINLATDGVASGRRIENELPRRT